MINSGFYESDHYRFLKDFFGFPKNQWSCPSEDFDFEGMDINP